MSKQKSFNMRLSPSEVAILEQRALDKGLSKSDYIRFLIAQDNSSCATAENESDSSFSSDDAKRKNRINVTLSDAELAKADKAANALGITRSAYIRSLIGKQRIKSITLNIDEQRFVELLHELRKQGVNLNQLAYRMNAGLNVTNDELQDVMQAHNKATSEVMKFLNEVNTGIAGDKACS